MDYYNLLSVDKNASKMEITKSYRKLAKKYHPDKGGDDVTFNKINIAYTILIEDNTRRIYDDYGAEAANDYANGFYNSFAASRGKYTNMQEETKLQNQSQNKIIKIYVDLECFYNGSTITYDHEDNEIKIDLPAGVQDNYHVSLPDTDLVICILQKPHHVFKRINNQLVMRQDINLSDALCGFEFIINHLDGTCKMIKERYLKNFMETKYIKGLGMPYSSNSLNSAGQSHELDSETNFINDMNNRKYGDLIIQYNVIYPQRIAKNARPIIKILLDNDIKLKDIANENITSERVYKTHRRRTNFNSLHELCPKTLNIGKNIKRDVDQCRQM